MSIITVLHVKYVKCVSNILIHVKHVSKGAFQIFLDKVISIKISLGLKIEGRKIEGRRRTEQQRMR